MYVMYETSHRSTKGEEAATLADARHAMARILVELARRKIAGKTP